MADTIHDTMHNTDDDMNATTNAVHGNTEPATGHDVGEGGALGAVGGAVVGMLAGGPIGAVIGAVAGGLASAGAVSVVDKHDHDYDRTAGTGGPNNSVIGTAPSHNYTGTDTDNTGVIGTTTGNAEVIGAKPANADANIGTTGTGVIGTTPSSYGSNLARNTGTTANNETVIPIVEEQLEVGKRQVQSGGAHIHTGVIETPVEQSVSLHEEHVTVSRQPVSQPVSDMSTAFKEQSFEVTETAEEAVVGKQARVVEEVVVGKTATDRTETIRDTVRRTDVEVDDLADGDVKTGSIKGR